jgi:hypothetical protein
MKVCIISDADPLLLQNENVAVGNEHLVNESTVSSDEENVKV